MSEKNQYNESKVLRLMSKGSELAFTQFYDRYRTKIYGVALQMLKSHEQAEDTVQEVFLKIWMKRQELDKINRIEGYLFMIARNQIFDTLKTIATEKETKKKLPLSSNLQSKTDHPVREKQYEELLARVIDLLPPQQKLIYHLSRRDGLSYENIAQQLQISPLTVKKHMSQALKFIREHIQYLMSAPVLTILHIFSH